MRLLGINKNINIEILENFEEIKYEYIAAVYDFEDFKTYVNLIF